MLLCFKSVKEASCLVFSFKASSGYSLTLTFVGSKIKLARKKKSGFVCLEAKAVILRFRQSTQNAHKLQRAVGFCSYVTT